MFKEEFEDDCPFISPKELEIVIAQLFSPNAAKAMMDEAAIKGGGMYGGANCTDIANITKYLALFGITIAAGCAVKSLPLGKTFDSVNFKQLFEFMRNFHLGMSFTDRITQTILYHFQSKQRSIVPESVKKFISIWCQFEEDKLMDNAKQSIINELVPTPMNGPVTIQSINDLMIENNNNLLIKIKELLDSRLQEGEKIIQAPIVKTKAANEDIVNEDEGEELEFQDAVGEEQSGGKKSRRRRGRKMRKTRILKKKRR
jgi:hypothetical protein